METVVNALTNLTYKKLYLIIALTNSRNPVAVFKKIIPAADHIIITRYQSSERRCYPPQQMARVLKPRQPVETFLDADMALDRALKLATKDDLILVTGSFFLAGELRQRWRPEIKLLRERKI